MKCVRTFAVLVWVLLGFPGPTDAADKEAVPMLRLSEWIGERVELAGHKSRIPWQHLMGHVEGKNAEYFDLPDGGQIVVHVAGGLDREDPVILTGRVLEVRGPSKRPTPPGGKETKADDSWVEYALDVERVTWVPKAGELHRLAGRFADPAVVESERPALEDRLVAGGLDAAPLLLALLKNPRVASRAETLLCRIVEPRNFRPPALPEPGKAATKPEGCRFQVKDWKAFFDSRKGRDLARIREELKPALERWYRSGGERQAVE
jgi:hypothetical protein